MRIDLRRGGVGMDVAVVVAIVAAGTAVAGVTNGPQPDPIPGCDVVLPAEEGVSFVIGSYGGSYDNPDYPWLTAAKASAMSSALVESLPDDVELEYAAPSNSLVFQPMMIYSENASLPDGITTSDLGGDSEASGVVGRDGVDASLRVSVQAWDRGIPKCVEGRVDERTTLPDGTVVDTLDTVSEYDGESTHRRSASAYFADTAVFARTSNEGADAALPLEVGELRSIVSNPELRVSALVPDGTPSPRRECGSSTENSVPPLSKDVVERVGAALSAQWNISFPDVRTDWPVGDLVPGSSGSGSACNRVTMTTPAGTSELSVDISVVENPWWRNAEPSDSPGVNRTTLPDGTLVTIRSDDVSWLTVLRPSNTLVQFSFGEGIDVNSLVEVASAPGLDL